MLRIAAKEKKTFGLLAATYSASKISSETILTSRMHQDSATDMNPNLKELLFLTLNSARAEGFPVLTDDPSMVSYFLCEYDHRFNNLDVYDEVLEWQKQNLNTL